ncbi:hypothetical protein D3C87_1024570 [compost metagenome]
MNRLGTRRFRRIILVVNAVVDQLHALALDAETRGFVEFVLADANDHIGDFLQHPLDPRIDFLLGRRAFHQERKRVRAVDDFRLAPRSQQHTHAPADHPGKGAVQMHHVGFFLEHHLGQTPGKTQQRRHVAPGAGKGADLLRADTVQLFGLIIRDQIHQLVVRRIAFRRSRNRPDHRRDATFDRLCHVQYFLHKSPTSNRKKQSLTVRICRTRIRSCNSRNRHCRSSWPHASRRR